MGDFFESDEALPLPIEDTIDLHTFLPKEIPSLLQDYLSECVKAGIIEVRIIHGKGGGFLREMVHSFLRDSPLVESFYIADERGGGWGATLVRLRKL
jgi:DNA-nicking Smr family endonuclease